MKKFRASVATLAATAAVLSPATASAAAPTQPVQGMTISIGMTSECTLGFNDHARGVSYTAAHCANGVNNRVRLVNTRTGQKSRTLGTITPSSRYVSSQLGNDWAEIVWDKGVTLGANPYSGDTMLTLDQVKRGEVVCYHGETTHRGTNKDSCGSYVGSVEESFVTDIADGLPGDSGGPIWVKDRGFIGVVSAGTPKTGIGTPPVINGMALEGDPVLWGSAPRDGAALDPVKVGLLQAQASKINQKVQDLLPPGWAVLDPDDPMFEDFPWDEVFPSGPAPFVPSIPPIPSAPDNPGAGVNPQAPSPQTLSPQAPSPQTPAPEPTPNGKSSKSSEKTDSLSSNADAMSSEKSTGEIVLIVVSVLVTVLPIVLKLAQAFM
ncbi:hypothetical protein A0K93_03800 [Corynebacterium sp. BCW_4722]|nr:hypothetical protein A0K93_03800 [Corynebacterium sp. BCW_4722]